MKNNMGFAYPVIDESKCTQCGVCSGICHVNNPNAKKEPLAYYTYKGKDSERLLSSSGALFPLLSAFFIEKGFYVAGVIFADDYLSAHYVVTRETEIIDKMRKSKYVEACLDNVFSKIKEMLGDNKKVLFVGTPCTVSALLKYTHHNDNLFTVDFMCFGNGSPGIYKDSITAFVRKKRKKLYELKKVDFRHKPFLRDSHTVMDIMIGSETYTLFPSEMPYYNGFVKRLLMRESCYHCLYNSLERVSDMTIGDVPGNKDALGESILLCNSKRSVDLINKLIMTVDGFCSMKEGDILTTKRRFFERNKPEIYDSIANCSDYSTIEKKYLCNNKRIRQIIRSVFRRVK